MPDAKQWWVVCSLGEQRRVLPLRWFYQYTQVINYVRVPKSPPALRGITFVSGQLVWLIDWDPGQVVRLPFEVWLQQTPTGVLGWILPASCKIQYESECNFASHEVVKNLCI